jgi:hypothetical protein
VIGYAIGFGGCVTVVALHVILAYLRRTERRISMPRAGIVAAVPHAVETPAIDSLDFVDPRVAKIISEIPQRRTRGHAYGRAFSAAR